MYAATAGCRVPFWFAASHRVRAHARAGGPVPVLPF
jgi:hypothetical protein